MHDCVSIYLIVRVPDYAMTVFLHIIAPLFGVSYYSGIFCSVFFPLGCAPREVVFESEWRECHRAGSVGREQISINQSVCMKGAGRARVQ